MATCSNNTREAFLASWLILSPIRRPGAEDLERRLCTRLGASSRGLAAIATEIFSRSGVNLLPHLCTGAQGIQELRREANGLGLNMSTEDAQGSESLTDAWARVGASVQPMAFMLVAALAPTLMLAE